MKKVLKQASGALSWLSGVSFALALSLVANYLSSESSQRMGHVMVLAGAALALCVVLAFLHLFTRPKPLQRGLIVAVRLTDWGGRWLESAKDFAQVSLAGGRVYEYQVAETDLSQVCVTQDIIKDLLDEERREIDETSRPHLPTALMLSMPSPLAFQLGARLRTVANYVAMQERIDQRGSQPRFYAAVDFRHRLTLDARPELPLIAEADLTKTGPYNDVAVVININKNSFRAMALDHAASIGCEASLVLDIAGPERVLPENERFMTHLVEWSNQQVGAFIDKVNGQALQAGRPLPAFHLYVKTPVSVAFGLGVHLGQRADFHLYYTCHGAVISLPKIGSAIPAQGRRSVPAAKNARPRPRRLVEEQPRQRTR